MESDEFDNNKRRKRFQSAFKVPTSNRPSDDHSTDPTLNWHDDLYDAGNETPNDESLDEEDFK